MNDERERLARELKTRSHDVGGHPFGMAEVRQRARGIVWRRRIATGAVAAAVLAVAVPAGLAATGGTDRGIGPINQPSPTVTHGSPSPSPDQSPAPSPSPSPSPTFPAGAIPLTAVGAARGADPGIIYLDGGVLHNGSMTEQLPAAYTDIAVYHGGWVALAAQNGDYSVVQLDQDNRVTSTQPGAAGLAVDGGGGRTAWFVAGASGQPGQLVQGIGTGMGEGQDSLPIPPGVTAHPVGYVRTGLVFETDGLHPQVSVTDFTPGTAEVWLKGALGAGGASEAANAISVQTKSTDFGSCWAVVDPGWTAGAVGHERWHTCDYSLGQFSLSGKYVAAYPAYVDGLGSSSVSILDASTGKPVVTFQRPTDSDLYVTDVAWEDDTHLLAVVHEDGGWQILRLGTDGSIVAASPAVPGGDENRPFFFAARP
ncbi:MAG TPA: hypothetical protein VFJ09_09135 [Nocardioidaceae bacterium]|nr:hypothetical protein [Nocardioidaceae bacterium]